MVQLDNSSHNNLGTVGSVYSKITQVMIKSIQWDNSTKIKPGAVGYWDNSSHNKV